MSRDGVCTGGVSRGEGAAVPKERRGDETGKAREGECGALRPKRLTKSMFRWLDGIILVNASYAASVSTAYCVYGAIIINRKTMLAVRPPPPPHQARFGVCVVADGVNKFPALVEDARTSHDYCKRK